MNSLVSFLVHYHVNKSCYRLPCHVNKSSYRLERVVSNSFFFITWTSHVHRLWHHVNNAWAPACNVVDIRSGSCTTSSVITAMQRESLKKIVFTAFWQLNTVKSGLQVENLWWGGIFIGHLRPAQNCALTHIFHGSGSKRGKTFRRLSRRSFSLKLT